ncbi:phage tail protein [Pararhizobium gei]|uniref:phage tail protein n=1 Tax=Pararhizobium gei TaxID=1395951 RepID=UPI0023DBBBE2|nr:phage tail protein [Rhizobium gei]
MKFYRILFLSGASYVVATPAHAGIETLIAGAIQGFLLSSTAIAATATGAIATIAANVIVGGALLGLSMLAQPKMPGAVKPAEAKSTFETGESSVIEGLGRVRVGGLKVFGNTDGDTRWRLVVRLHGPIDAVEQYFVGGREVTLDPNGDVVTPPWSRKGSSWLNWQDKRGFGDETAWPDLIEAFPSLWTADHQVRGVAQSLLTYRNPGMAKPKYLSLYQGGVPDTEQIQRASVIYDPRIGMAAWTENGILCAAHVLRRDPAFTFERFDWDKIAAQADKADVLVATLTGTEKRARIGGMWAWEGARAETMKSMLDSIGVEIRLSDAGKIWFELIDDEPEPEIAFHVEDGYKIAWASGPEAVERPNVCRLKYYSSERNYDIAEIDLTGIAWANIESEIDRYGEKVLDLELPFCPSASQAQRIARRLFAKARGETGSLVTNMVGLAAWGALYGTVELPDLGDIELVRLSSPRCDDANGSVEIPFAVCPVLDPWNPATDEAPAPDAIPDLDYETDLDAPAAPSSAVQLTNEDGSKTFRVNYVITGDDHDDIEANYRVYYDGNPSAWFPMSEEEDHARASVDLSGAIYDARVRIFDEDDEASLFSDLLHGAIAASTDPCRAPELDEDTIVNGAFAAGTPATIIISAVPREYRVHSMRFQRRIQPAGGAWSAWSTLATNTAAMNEINLFADSVPAATGVGALIEWQLQSLLLDGTPGTALVSTATILA